MLFIFKAIANRSTALIMVNKNETLHMLYDIVEGIFY